VFLLLTTTSVYGNAAYQIFVTSSPGKNLHPVLFACVSTCESLATTCETQKWIPGSRRFSFTDAVTASVCFDKCSSQQSSSNIRVTTAMSARELSDDVHEETFTVYTCIADRIITSTERKTQTVPNTIKNTTASVEKRAFAVFVPTSYLCEHAADFHPPAEFHALVNRTIHICDIEYKFSTPWTTARMTWPFSPTVTLSRFCNQPHPASLVHMSYSNSTHAPECIQSLLASFLSIAPDTRLVSTVRPSTTLEEREGSKLWLYMDTTVEQDHNPYRDELDLLPCMNTDHKDTVSWLPSWKLASYNRLFNFYIGRYNRTQESKESKSGNPIWLQFGTNMDQATRCALTCAVSGLRFAWKVQYEEMVGTSVLSPSIQTGKSLVLLSSVFEHGWLSLADAISGFCTSDLSPMKFLTYGRVDRLQAFPSLVLRRNVTATAASRCQSEVGRAGGLVVIVDDTELWQWADTSTLSLQYNPTTSDEDEWGNFILCMHGIPIMLHPQNEDHLETKSLKYTVDVKHDETIIVLACMRRWLGGRDSERASLWDVDGTQQARQVFFSDFNRAGYTIEQEVVTLEVPRVHEVYLRSHLEALESLSTGPGVVAKFLRTAATHADVVVKCGLPAVHSNERLHLVEVLDTPFIHLTHTVSCLYALRLFCNSLVECTGWFWSIKEYRVRTPTLMWTMPILWESAHSITQAYVNQVIDLMIPIKQHEWDVCSGGTILGKWQDTDTVGLHDNMTSVKPSLIHAGSMSSAWWRQHSFASFTALPNVTTLSHPRFLVMSAGAYLPALSGCCRAMLLDFTDDHDQAPPIDESFQDASVPSTPVNFMPNWIQDKDVDALHCFSGYASAGVVNKHTELSHRSRNLRAEFNKSDDKQGTDLRSNHAIYHEQWNLDRLHRQGPSGRFENLITDSSKGVPWQIFFIICTSVDPERARAIRIMIMENCAHLHSSCKPSLHAADVTSGTGLVAIHTDPEIIITIYRWLVATKNLDVEFHSGGIFLPTKSYAANEVEGCSYSLMVITLVSAIVFMFMCWLLFKSRLLPRAAPLRSNFRVPVVPMYAEQPGEEARSRVRSLDEGSSGSDDENDDSYTTGESDTFVDGQGKRIPTTSTTFPGLLNCNSSYSARDESVEALLAEEENSDPHDTAANYTEHMLAYDLVVDELYAESTARFSTHPLTEGQPIRNKKNT
jgi:hypothetical protein